MRVHPALAIQDDGGVLKSRIGCGLVTVEGMAQLCAESGRVLDGDRPHIVLADMRRPLWALSDSQITGLYAGCDQSVIAPAALVVTTESYPMFRRHAWSVAQLGVMRKIFTDYESAQEWCRLRLRLAGRLQTAP